MEEIGFDFVFLILKPIVFLVFHIVPCHEAKEEAWDTIETALSMVKSVALILGRAQLH